MAEIIRNVILMSKRQNGKDVVNYPITTLKNIEDKADTVDDIESEDMVPVIDRSDGNKMKKTSLTSFLAKMAEIAQLVDIDDALVELAAYVTEFKTQLDEQSAAIVELASLIDGLPAEKKTVAGLAEAGRLRMAGGDQDG